MKFPYQTVSSITHDLRGFYRINHEDYHAGPGLSSSKLKKALISYAAYTQEEPYDSAALSFGRSFHAALLEPELFAAKWTVQPKFDGHPNSNAYKAARAVWNQGSSGKTVISHEEASTIEKMIAAVKSHPYYANLSKFQPEIMAVTTCQDTGFKIKCKADLLGHAIIDFKTTSSGVQESETMWDIERWDYHVSAAFYQDIVHSLTGERLPFIVVPVSKKPPFDCEFYDLSEEILEEGRKLYKTALRRIMRWDALAPNLRGISDKRIRALHPSQKLLYTTRKRIEFIEGT